MEDGGREGGREGQMGEVEMDEEMEVVGGEETQRMGGGETEGGRRQQCSERCVGGDGQELPSGSPRSLCGPRR